MGASTPGAADIRLAVHSDADDVTLVRQLLSGVAEACEIDATSLNDINTAVTEACNNVVLHAYGDGSGEMLVDVALDSQVAVTVADRGSGIGPVQGLRGPTEGGLGIPVMLALASSVEYRDAEPSGTIVRMLFDVNPRRVEHTAGLRRPEEGVLEPGSARLTVYSSTCAPPVCKRVLAAYAARARLSTGTFDEVAGIASALATIPDVDLRLEAMKREMVIGTDGAALPDLGTLNLLSATVADGALRIREL